MKPKLSRPRVFGGWRCSHRNGALLVCSMLLAGCGSKKTEPAKAADSPSPQAIAIIDLNVVAQEIGAIDKIRQSLRDREFALDEHLASLSAEQDDKYKSTRASYGDDLNQQQQDELERLLAEHQKQLALQRQAAQTQIATHHAQLKLNLLEQVRPVAYDVAQEKGMSIVLTTAQIYAAAPQVNITQQVIKRIQEINSQSEPVAPERAEPPVRTAELPVGGGGDFLPR